MNIAYKLPIQSNVGFYNYFAEGWRTILRQLSAETGQSILTHQIRWNPIRPVRRNSKLVLEMSVKDINDRKFGMEYKLTDLTDTSILYAKGESIQVCVDTKQSSAVPVSPRLREKLAEYRCFTMTIPPKPLTSHTPLFWNPRNSFSTSAPPYHIRRPDNFSAGHRSDCCKPEALYYVDCSPLEIV